jgi:hypothetical protein
VANMARNYRYSLGWRPDLPDIRDYRPESENIQKILSKSKALKATPKQLPTSVDLRPRCSPVEDQGDLGSCTANGGVGLIEYFERRAFGKYMDASRLFLYEATRTLAGDKGDGADIKLTEALLSKTYNYHAVKTGLAYLGLYSGGLSFDIQSKLIATYKKAKTAKSGLWKLDQTKRFTATRLEDLEPEQGSLIYPKIFRRCVDALRWVGGEFEPGRDLDDFLAELPREDDKLIAHVSHGGQLKSRLSQVLEQVNNQIRIQVDLSTVEFISK